MFNIDYLLTPLILERLNSIQGIKEQTSFLFSIIEFDVYFPDICNDIAAFWYQNTGERYNCIEYIITNSDKTFILEYASNIRNLGKVKSLINKLCSISDGVYDHDTIIADAVNEISTIQNIDDFDFTEDLGRQKQNKPTLTSVLSMKPKAQK